MLLEKNTLSLIKIRVLRESPKQYRPIIMNEVINILQNSSSSLWKLSHIFKIILHHLSSFNHWVLSVWVRKFWIILIHPFYWLTHIHGIYKGDVTHILNTFRFWIYIAWSFRYFFPLELFQILKQVSYTRFILVEEREWIYIQWVEYSDVRHTQLGVVEIQVSLVNHNKYELSKWRYITYILNALRF